MKIYKIYKNHTNSIKIIKNYEFYAEQLPRNGHNIGKTLCLLLKIPGMGKLGLDKNRYKNDING